MREPTLFARSSWTMIVITSPAYVDDGAPFTALYSRAPIDVVKLFVNGGQHAFLLRRRSELLLFDVAFTGSSECAIHPVAQHASPDALSKAARQHLLPFSFSPTHADVCLCTGDAGRRGRGAKILLLGAGGAISDFIGNSQLRCAWASAKVLAVEAAAGSGGVPTAIRAACPAGGGGAIWSTYQIVKNI